MGGGETFSHTNTATMYALLPGRGEPEPWTVLIAEHAQGAFHALLQDHGARKAGGGHPGYPPEPLQARNPYTLTPTPPPRLHIVANRVKEGWPKGFEEIVNETLTRSPGATVNPKTHP